MVGEQGELKSDGVNICHMQIFTPSLFIVSYLSSLTMVCSLSGPTEMILMGTSSSASK